MDAPGLIRGTQEDYKRLYYSNPDAALKVPITIDAGYGILKAGTTLAISLSAAGNTGKFVPYNPTTVTGAEVAPGRAYLVQDSGTTASILYVTMDDSYKFAVGDDVIIHDDTTTAENLGAITAIDRTTYTHMAAITVTTATGGTSFTTANFAYIAAEAGVSANSYSDCVGVLEKSVDTGVGVNANGALATLILGNCVLYTGVLTNMDAAAIVDVSAASIGNFTYIK
jgi:hypothetical protein